MSTPNTLSAGEIDSPTDGGDLLRIYESEVEQRMLSPVRQKILLTLLLSTRTEPTWTHQSLAEETGADVANIHWDLWLVSPAICQNGFQFFSSQTASGESAFTVRQVNI